MISEPELVIRLLLSSLFGGILGYEREVKHKPAGLRTHILVSLGSTLFTILSFYAFPGADPARVASYILIGVGFIAGGAIIQSEDHTTGITTASSLWVTSSIGMAVGIGFYLAALIVTMIAYFTLFIRRFEKKP